VQLALGIGAGVPGVGVGGPDGDEATGMPAGVLRRVRTGSGTTGGTRPGVLDGAGRARLGDGLAHRVFAALGLLDRFDVLDGRPNGTSPGATP